MPLGLQVLRIEPADLLVDRLVLAVRAAATMWRRTGRVEDAGVCSPRLKRGPPRPGMVWVPD
jgi:hypothetical protein